MELQRKIERDELFNKFIHVTDVRVELEQEPRTTDILHVHNAWMDVVMADDDDVVDASRRALKLN
jgi:hypothetical protein